MAGVTTSEHQKIIGSLAQTLYEPWVQACAKTLQAQVIDTGAYPGPNAFPESTYAPGTCLFFVDGLRYDLGVRLRDALSAEGLRVDEGTPVWSALPSVTATAKPAVAPLAHLVDAGVATETFEPRLRESQLALDSARLKSHLKKCGWQVLAGSDTGDPSGLGWAETKEIDDAGHAGKPGFAANLDALLGDIVRRVRDLVTAGWASVHVVTDHGWLYLPGALPKEELDNLLAVSRWGRSAAVKEGVNRRDMLAGALDVEPGGGLRRPARDQLFSRRASLLPRRTQPAGVPYAAARGGGRTRCIPNARDTGHVAAPALYGRSRRGGFGPLARYSPRPCGCR